MNIVFSVVPFLLLVGLWLIPMRNHQRRRQTVDPVVKRLEAIFEEIARIRHELAERHV